jgi:hypothetical protein
MSCCRRGRRSHGDWLLLLAFILTGATFGVSPILGGLLVTAEVTVIVALLVRYLRPAKRQP